MCQFVRQAASGADQEVLKLLRESGNSLRSLLVINHDLAGGEEAQARVMDQFGGRGLVAPGPGVSSAEFSRWAQSPELDSYFETLE